MTRSHVEQDGACASGVAGGAEVALGVNEASDGPLTVHPKHPTADDVYFIGGAWAPSCITAQEKRFTDAELAAEYHAAWAEMLDVPKDERYPYESARIETLYRFATRPHYDEERA